MKRETSTLSIWLPVVFWTVVIAFESAFGSSANTGPLLQQLATWLLTHVDPVRLEVFHHTLRKGGHFLGYGIFGYVWFRAFIRTFTSCTRLTCAGLAVACTFSIAGVDEWHQSLSSARTGQFIDVVLDTFGALVLVSLAMFTGAPRRKTGIVPG